MKRNNLKILIIGQGIAGTLLANELLQKGVQVHLAEAGETETSSQVAAGVINPVTGKRFVKSWRFDAFYSLAKQTYQALERSLGIAVWEEHPIMRLLASPEEINS